MHHGPQAHDRGGDGRGPPGRAAGGLDGRRADCLGAAGQAPLPPARRIGPANEEYLAVPPDDGADAGDRTVGVKAGHGFESPLV